MDIWSGKVTRRSVFQIGLVSLGIIATPIGALTRPDSYGHLDGTTRTANAAPQAVAGVEAPRYLFVCESSLGYVGPFTKVEEVWSSPSYMKMTSVTVMYIGSGSLVLNDEESSIVAVAEKAGMTVSDKPALYMTILEVCARVATEHLDERLHTLGAPVVKAALAREPHAPQAQLLAGWLDANG
jgi:hypothetical protein